MTIHRLPLIDAVATGADITGAAPGEPIPGAPPSDESSNAEERELFRLATHIAQYDGRLTEILVRSARMTAQRESSMTWFE